MRARGRSVTVTEIATALGFVELGRFSVEYRKAFGECPSETLRQAFREHGRDDGALNDRVVRHASLACERVASENRLHSSVGHPSGAASS